MSAIPRLPALAAAHLVLCALVLAWDLYMAGRIASIRTTPALLSALSAVSGLLIAPALFILLANDSLLTSRALWGVAWVWPVTAALVAAQAVYALSRGLVAPAIGIPIVAYDVALGVIYAVRYTMSHGAFVSEPVLALSAAERTAVALGTGANALLLPFYLHIPILAPATRGRRGWGTVARGTMAALAAGWTALLIASIPPATRAVRSYDRYVGVRLQERPDSDFTVGLKVFPTLHDAPSPLSLGTDIALADSIGAAIISVYIAPDGASSTALDSLASALEQKRSAVRLIAALDWTGTRQLRDRRSRERYIAARLTDVERIARRLHPDYLVPVLDPTGAASAVVGPLPIDRWERYLRDASATVHRANPAVAVMAHVGGFAAGDSALYAWAVHEPALDAVALSLSPGFAGAVTLDERTRTVDRWLAATPSRKEQWILEASAFPRGHGELNQARAVWAMLAWATSRNPIKGLVLFEASDYASPLGLRAPSGRWRPAALAARQAVRALTGVSQ